MSIKTIKLKIGKRTIELTEKEARELALDLDALGFGVKVAPPPIVIERPVRERRIYPGPYWYSNGVAPPDPLPGTTGDPLPQLPRVTC